LKNTAANTARSVHIKKVDNVSKTETV